mmetsp:Transcript_8858/g.36589  ORF Transcript_8858/g.36589 Transcript_8858/m.36589 type:complete len:278 (+) Transcript_8858:672-1505(+)
MFYVVLAPAPARRLAPQRPRARAQSRRAQRPQHLLPARRRRRALRRRRRRHCSAARDDGLRGVAVRAALAPPRRHHPLVVGPALGPPLPVLFVALRLRRARPLRRLGPRRLARHDLPLLARHPRRRVVARAPRRGRDRTLGPGRRGRRQPARPLRLLAPRRQRHQRHHRRPRPSRRRHRLRRRRPRRRRARRRWSRQARRRCPGVRRRRARGPARLAAAWAGAVLRRRRRPDASSERNSSTHHHHSWSHEATRLLPPPCSRPPSLSLNVEPGVVKML